MTVLTGLPKTMVDKTEFLLQEPNLFILRRELTPQPLKFRFFLDKRVAQLLDDAYKQDVRGRHLSGDHSVRTSRKLRTNGYT